MFIYKWRHHITSLHNRTARSNVFSHVSASFDGLTSIRALSLHKEFKSEFDMHQVRFYEHTRTHIRTYAYTHITYAYSPTRTYVYLHIHEHTLTYIRTRTRTRAYAYAPKRTHTHAFFFKLLIITNIVLSLATKSTDIGVVFFIFTSFPCFLSH